MTIRDDIISFYFLSSHSIRSTAKRFRLSPSVVGTIILTYKREHDMR